MCMSSKRTRFVFLFWLFISTFFVLLIAHVCYVFYLIQVVKVFRNSSDIDWVLDHTRLFIRTNKKMPENWSELKDCEFYKAIDGIESRIEVNFELLKRINTGEMSLAPINANNKTELWIYRFYRFPNVRGQKKIIDELVETIVVQPISSDLQPPDSDTDSGEIHDGEPDDKSD